MASNLSHRLFEPGAQWTFVHANGKRTEYVYDRRTRDPYQDPKSGYGLAAMCALWNPQTDRYAQVTERWLRDEARRSAASQTGFQSHWLPGEPSTAEVAEEYTAGRDDRAKLP